MMLALVFGFAFIPVVGMAALYLGKGNDGQGFMRAQRRRALAATSHEHAREALLERWNRGERSGARLEYAEGERYVTGHGVDNEWVGGLMASDDRLRRWNGKRPRGMALSMRRD